MLVEFCQIGNSSLLLGPFFISWLLHFCFYISLDSRSWAALSLREGLLCFSQSALYNSASRHCSVDDLSVSSPGALQPEGQQQPESYSPPSISQSTMKRVTIRARALIPAGSILLLNGLKQHNLPAGRSGRGQNLAALWYWTPNAFIGAVPKIVLLIGTKTHSV